MPEFSYQLATPIGQIRLLIPDKLEAEKQFSDDELAGLLTLEGGSVKLAAAQALDIISTDTARVESYRRTQALEVDGSKAAKVIADRAASLRKQSIIVATPVAPVEDDEEGLIAFVSPCRRFRG